MNIYIAAIIITPLAAGAAILLTPARWRGVKEALALSGAAVDVALAALLLKSGAKSSVAWAGFGMDLSFRAYALSSFIILAAGLFGLLVSFYSAGFLTGKGYSKQFYSYLLLSLGFVNGAVLADNLAAVLFFWEGLLITLFAMIAIGKVGAFKTATKAFIIVGAADLCLMGGIAITASLAGTFTISDISLAASGLGGVAFLLLITGAIAKAGSMPFHSWIPDAAEAAPLPFMAMFPAAIEKLVGIYFLARITLDMFKLGEGSWASVLLMTVGALTIIFAVMMALVQKDYKKLLAYHAISQAGYMILGIGTLVPAGIVGGLFHMINNAIYKSGLFMTGGAVEKSSGTTDLAKLGGIGRRMPVTFFCFIICALSISGCPPFNGFFSKELVYDGALGRGRIFYIAALLGSFLTAASFLKLGHSAFLGDLRKENKNVKEAPAVMLIPMIALTALCVLFGLWNRLPIDILIRPGLAPEYAGKESLAGFPTNWTLVALTVTVLLAALANHIYGVKRAGSALKAVDHIHYAPGLAEVYDRAERGQLDPYNAGRGAAKLFSRAMWLIDRTIDLFYDVFSVRSVRLLSASIRRVHNGSHKMYIIWSVAGFLIILLFLVKG